MIDDEAIKEFLVESHENLDRLDRDFVALEADPTADDRLAAIFRTVHTVKGTSGFLGFSKLEALTHAGESLLAKIRDGVLVLTPTSTTALLALVDRTRVYLRSIEATGVEGPEDCLELAAQLARLAEGGREEPSAVVTAPIAPPPPAPPSPVASEDLPTGRPPAPPPVPAAPVATPAPTPSSIEMEAAAPPAAPAAAPEVTGPTVSDTSVRVDVGLLDKLMNLVGELVLARNQILQFGASTQDAGFLGASQRLNLITTELQGGVMKTRMQPIGNVWNKLPRVVRDLAVACGKQVRIEMVGKETELDRTIIEAIKDPLTHIVRNAVDHGIESPDARAAAGKPRTGNLIMRAFHEGGQVNIEIADDGGGIDARAIREKATLNGLITPERAARMTDRELFQLVFLPGFSTAQKVTNVSGRGVGMDVVKTNIEKIGGTVDLQSVPGRGTTLRIKIPLTLAIVPALIVTSRGHRFAISQVSLLELVRLDGAAAQKNIESIHGARVYRLRGNLLPLVDLAEALSLRDLRPKSTQAADAEDVVTNIVVLKADDRQFGLIVDEIRDTEEIVVKPLGKELKSVAVFAGATVMGDGRVALILDVVGLAQRAGAASTLRDRSQGGEGKGDITSAKREEQQSLLLFRVGKEGCMAIPLSMVARLEEFAPERIERSGKRTVVQYRGEILPLIDLSSALGGPPSRPPAGDPISVVVYSDKGRSVGLVVDSILDIVDDVADGRRASANGVSGAAVIQGRVTELLDVHALIKRQDHSMGGMA